MSSSAVESLCDSLESLWVSDPLTSALNNGMSWADVPGVVDYKIDMERFDKLRQAHIDAPPAPPAPKPAECPIFRTPNARDFESSNAEKSSWIEGVDFYYDSEDDDDDDDSDDDYEYVSLGEAMVWKSVPMVDYEERDKQRARDKYNKPDTIIVDISIRAPAPAPEPVSAPEPIVPPVATGIKTLIARNLPRGITVHQMRAVFEKYGPIKDIYIPKNMDKSSPYFGTTKGFALIKFINSEHSAKAFTSEYGRLIIGRNNINLEFAKEDR